MTNKKEKEYKLVIEDVNGEELEVTNEESFRRAIELVNATSCYHVREYSKYLVGLHSILSNAKRMYCLTDTAYKAELANAAEGLEIFLEKFQELLRDNLGLFGQLDEIAYIEGNENISGQELDELGQLLPKTGRGDN